MIKITEKLWDSIRPGSVKKTGLSDVIRSTTKALDAVLVAPADYSTADKALGKLIEAIDKAKTAVKNAKADNNGKVAAKLNDWRDDCKTVRAKLDAERKELGVFYALAEVTPQCTELKPCYPL